MPAPTTASPYERRIFPMLEVKALDDAAGTFSGYLAVFNNVDQGGDIIQQGAFAKSLADLQTKQRSRKSRYVLPIFWSHMPEEPLGGFVEASEDSHGLYVKGELDLDIEQGRRAYSGLKRGYLSGMSIGYITVKQSYENGARVLKELRLLEGSLTAIPMNEEAQVASVKSATGKVTWPLGERDAAWDNGAAHQRIVAWATDESDNVDTAKMQSVHFYSPDGDAAENISEYKLLFCDVADGGEVKAMPRGIEACAGAHGVDATTSISDSEKATIRNKISAYYKKMAKAFNDDSIVAPWDAKEKGTRMPSNLRPHKKARDFSTHFQALAQSDQLQDDWADTFLAIVRCFSDLMWQSQAQTNGWIPDGAEMVDIPQAAQSNLTAFATAVNDLVVRSMTADFVPRMDDDGDSFYDPDGDEDECNYMSRDTRTAGQKAGRVMSTANHSEMGDHLSTLKKALDTAKVSHKALSDMHMHMSPGTQGNAATDEPSTSDTQKQQQQPRMGATDDRRAETTGAGAGAASRAQRQDALDSSATPTAAVATNTDDTDDAHDAHDEQLSDDARDLALKIQTRLLAMKLQQQTQKGAA